MIDARYISVLGACFFALVGLSNCTAPSGETKKQPNQVLIVYEPGASDDESEVEEDDPIVCRKRAVTGSRLATERQCARESQWARIDAQQRDAYSNYSRSSSAGS